MLRSICMLLALPLVMGAAEVVAQAKKAPARVPSEKDPSIIVTVYMKDAKNNELLLGTHIWPDNLDYDTIALQRFFALMKMLEPAYKQDDNVAYSWSTKGKVAKCSIYLESFDAGVKNGTGASVGCEANGVSSVAVSSVSDPKHGVSSSQDPKHLADVVDLFKKQLERAKGTVPKQ